MSNSTTHSLFGAALTAALALACSEDPGTPNQTGAGGAGMGGAGVGGAGIGGAGIGGAGVGGAGIGGTAGTGAMDTLPADNSAATLQAFLDAKSFTAADWVSETPAPRAGTFGSPHGTVRVYMSRPLVEAKRAEPDPLVSPAVDGAMVVKEIYDATNAAAGYAVMLWLASAGDWTYFCYGPQITLEGASAPGSSCTGGPEDMIMREAPIHGTTMASSVTSCRSCHNGSVYTPPPP